MLLGFFAQAPSVKVFYHTVQMKPYYIEYSKDRKLTWSDFKETKRKYVQVALTASQISYNVTYDNNEMVLNVSCVFDKQHSTVVRGFQTDYILNHEQRHFDITYIYTAKFIKALKNAHNLTMEEVDELYNNIYDEWTAYQAQYDSESGNATITNRQAAWDKKIDEQLQQVTL
jgi:hypothetical protein